MTTDHDRRRHDDGIEAALVQFGTELRLYREQAVQERAEHRQDITALHEKINAGFEKATVALSDHAMTCPYSGERGSLNRRVSRLEGVEQRRIGVLAAVGTIAGVLGAFVIKPLLEGVYRKLGFALIVSHIRVWLLG